MDKDEIQQERRGFLKQFGATMGAAGLGAAGLGVAGSRPVHAAAPKGNIPNRPVKVGSTPRAGCSASARSRRSSPTRPPGPMPT